MDVLAIIHGESVRPGVFGEAIAERGHNLEEWSLAWGTPPPRPIDDYGAIFVFGGAMHADQDDHHPWLREENMLLQRVLDCKIPALGVCLGAQLLARAAHAPVGPAPQPEIGWTQVVLTPDAEEDPLLARFPDSFEAFQWHYYTYGLPNGAVELARSSVCTQAFRLGSSTWGIQFHAEVTQAQIEAWLADEDRESPIPREQIAAETREKIGDWNELGRRLCGGFLEVAERVPAPA